ncbi:MAG: nucleotidyltransferase [Rhodothermales bacterium]
MSRDRVEAAHFSPDTRDFIRLLHRHDVRYVIVGGEAVIYYGYARLTGDVDFFYEGRASNAKRLFEALLDFWGGDVPGVSEMEELMHPGLILQFGRPPNRIDLLNQIAGVSFDAVWETRLTLSLVSDDENTPMYYIALEHLIANKQAAGRPKDLEDLSYLRSVSGSDAE